MAHESTPLTLSEALWPPVASMVGVPNQAAADVALAHALRTPLTVIRGQSQLLRFLANRPGGLNLAAILQAAARIEEATSELTAAIDGMNLCDSLVTGSSYDVVVEGETTARDRRAGTSH